MSFTRGDRAELLPHTQYSLPLSRKKSTGKMKKIAKIQLFFRRGDNCQKATAAAAATFRESTPWAMGILTV
jgi:hypothetical protein